MPYRDIQQYMNKRGLCFSGKIIPRLVVLGIFGKNTVMMRHSPRITR